MRLKIFGMTMLLMLIVQVAQSTQIVLFDADHQRLTVQADSILPAALLEGLARETGIEIVAPSLSVIPVRIGFSSRNLSDGLRFIARTLGYNHILYYSGNRVDSETPQRFVLVATGSRILSRPLSVPPAAPARSEIYEEDDAPPVDATTATAASSRQQENRRQREQKGYERMLAQAEHIKDQPERYQRQLERLERKFPKQFSPLNSSKE